MSDEQTVTTSKGQKYSGWWWRPLCPRAAAHEEEGEGGMRWAIGLPCPEQKASGPESMLTAQSATMKGTVARRSGRLTSLAEAPQPQLRLNLLPTSQRRRWPSDREESTARWGPPNAAAVLLGARLTAAVDVVVVDDGASASAATASVRQCSDFYKFWRRLQVLEYF